MYPVSGRFLSSVRKSHVSKVKVEIFDAANGTVISTASPIGGEVTIDSRRSVRRQCSLEFVDANSILIPKNNRSSILLPYNREIKVYRGVEYQDGTEELVPLGVFDITSVEVTDTPSGVKITVQGSDKSLKISKSKWVSHNFYIEENTPKETAIAQILKDRYPGVKIDFPATGQVTTILYPTLDTSSDPWKEALKIAESAGMDLYFDANGVARMRPIPDPDLGDALIEYLDGEESVLTQLGRSLSSDESYNHVIYTGEGSNLTIGVIGEAFDDNPSSPTYINTYGSVPIFKSSPNILTVAEAEEAARAELKKVIGASEKITWDQIVNPAHDVYDLVRVVRSPSGVNAILMLDALTIPLAASSTMNAIGRSRRF